MNKTPTPQAPQKVTEQATPLDIGLESHYLLKQLIYDGFYPSNGGLCWSYIEETTIGQVCGQDIETRIRAIIKREPGSAINAPLAPSDAKNPLKDKDPMEVNHTPHSAPWTPEPWRADERAPVSGVPSEQSTIPFAISRPNTGFCTPIADVCAFPPSTSAQIETMRANAERIVTCVNALAGISNPAAVKEVIKQAQRAVDSIRPDYLKVEALKIALAALGEHEKQ